jgi:hypothetical protein
VAGPSSYQRLPQSDGRSSERRPATGSSASYELLPVASDDSDERYDTRPTTDSVPQLNGPIHVGAAELDEDEDSMDIRHAYKLSSSEDAEFDDSYEGLEFPTEEEQQTLRRVADAIPWTAYSE